MSTKTITVPRSKEVALSKSKDFSRFKETLEGAKRILISTHQLPDGDGLGAEAALFHYLKRGRKAVRVYNPDPLPRRYSFLDPKKQVLLGPGEVELWDHCDLWIILDTNDPRRLGRLWNEMMLRAKKIVFLDHHVELPGQAVTYPPHATVLSDTSSSSIGEMLHEIFRELNLAKTNLDVAVGLYVSVMTDTNSFRSSRTTSHAHRIAAEMIELGVNPEEIYQAIYSSKELSHVQLLGHMLQNVKFASHGKIAWLEMPLELRRRHQASSDDTQSFLNQLMILRDPEVVCLFREEDDGQIRVSIKSKGRLPVNKVAAELGGGGHDYAAGVALSHTLEKGVSIVVQKLEAALTHYEKFGK